MSDFSDLESASFYKDRQEAILTLLDNLRLHAYEEQHALAKLLEGNCNRHLPADLSPNFTAMPRSESSNDLEACLKTIQIKLFGLLELW